MFVGAQEPGDTVEIIGNPNLTLTIPGGTHGDIATASVVVNCIPAILDAPAGCAPRAICRCASSRPTQIRSPREAIPLLASASKMAKLASQAIVYKLGSPTHLSTMAQITKIPVAAPFVALRISRAAAAVGSGTPN